VFKAVQHNTSVAQQMSHTNVAEQEYKTSTGVINKSHLDSLGFTECDNFVYENFIQHPFPAPSMPPCIVFIKPSFYTKNEKIPKKLKNTKKIKKYQKN
jgi:hypothetical protein